MKFIARKTGFERNKNKTLMLKERHIWSNKKG
jgi:hypothetical protein